MVLGPILEAQVPEGDQHWNARAEGHNGGHARAAQVDAAIAAYRKAATANTSDLESRWKLLRALRFKGAYVAATSEEKKLVYGEGKKAGEEAMALLDRVLRAKGVASLARAGEKQVADASRAVPGAAEIFLWDAVNWGEWALAYGKLAAVREGAADRIRREATIALLIDPRLEGAAPGRVLGRLHDETPRVPFITGWASGREAVRFLSASLKIDPTNKITRVFLAEAMVNEDSGRRAQAVLLLRETLSAPNDHQLEVEMEAANEDARTLLRKWGG